MGSLVGLINTRGLPEQPDLTLIVLWILLVMVTMDDGYHHRLEAGVATRGSCRPMHSKRMSLTVQGLGYWQSFMESIYAFHQFILTNNSTKYQKYVKYFILLCSLFHNCKNFSMNLQVYPTHSIGATVWYLYLTSYNYLLMHDFCTVLIKKYESQGWRV